MLVWSIFDVFYEMSLGEGVKQVKWLILNIFVYIQLKNITFFNVSKNDSRSVFWLFKSRITQKLALNGLFY